MAAGRKSTFKIVVHTKLLSVYPTVPFPTTYNVRFSLNTGWAKNSTIFVHFIISPNINRFSHFFHCQNHETICNKTITTVPNTLQVCRYTTFDTRVRRLL